MTFWCGSGSADPLLCTLQYFGEKSILPYCIAEKKLTDVPCFFQVMKLTEETEEVATFYGKMLDHDYTTKEVFNKNFFKDWRKVMTEKEKDVIRYGVLTFLHYYI
jgi:hypothetical protein